MSYSISDLQSYGQQAAANNGIPWNVFNAQITQESGWNPNAYNSSSGATGIAQFLPSTANNAGYGIQPFDPTDPYASLDAAAQYDAALTTANGGNLNAGLSSYSGGGYTADSLTGGSSGASPYGATSTNGGMLDPETGAPLDPNVSSNPLSALGASAGNTVAGWGSLFQEWAARFGIGALAILLIIAGAILLGVHTVIKDHVL